MLKPETAITCLRLILASGLALPLLARADFIEDSQGSLELRNFYQNRDFRQSGAAKSQVGNWSQAFMLRMQSGFTEGPVSFGLDYLGLLGSNSTQDAAAAVTAPYPLVRNRAGRWMTSATWASPARCECRKPASTSASSPLPCPSFIATTCA